MKNKNILGLLSTHTVKPILTAGVILCVLQFGCAVLSDQTSLYMIIDNPFIKYSFLVAFVFVITICEMTVKESLSKITLNRLGVSKKRMFCDVILNTFMSLITIWGFQVLSLMIISAYFVMNAESQFVNPQTIYLASFRSNFFHVILPTIDITGWFVLFSLFFMNSVLVSRCIFILKSEFNFILATMLTFCYFAGGVVGLYLGILYLGIALFTLYKGVTQNEEND